MAQSIQSHQEVLYIPYTAYSVAVNKTHLCAARWVFAVCFLGGCGVALSSISQYRLPTEAYVVDAVATVVSGVAFAGTYFTKKMPPEQEALVPAKLAIHQAPSVADVSEESMKLIEKLCDGQGKCDLTQAKGIVEELEQQKQLALLNIIPPFDSGDLGAHFYTHETQRTPLQCWAAEGDLEICQLLIEHGALDYCGGDNNSSALYEAAFYGHRLVVHYLMDQGAHAHLAFQNNPLFSFIPKFAFEMIWCKTHQEYQECFACFRIILDSHSKHHSENLKFQLKVPIDEQEANILGWLKKMQLIRTHNQGPMILELQAMLIEFGASEHDRLTKADLTDLGLNIGSGSTLSEIASQK